MRAEPVTYGSEPGYDAEANGRACYALAIAELRREFLQSGHATREDTQRSSGRTEHTKRPCALASHEHLARQGPQCRTEIQPRRSAEFPDSAIAGAGPGAHLGPADIRERAP